MKETAPLTQGLAGGHRLPSAAAPQLLREKRLGGCSKPWPKRFDLAKDAERLPMVQPGQCG